MSGTIRVVFTWTLNNDVDAMNGLGTDFYHGSRLRGRRSSVAEPSASRRSAPDRPRRTPTSDAATARLELHLESLMLRRSAWWYSLRGLPATTNKESERIKIPRGQVFDVDALSAMVARIRAGGLP